MMKEVTKEEFDSFVKANCSNECYDEPRIEHDYEYLYECYDDAGGEEIAFISWVDGNATYRIKT